MYVCVKTTDRKRGEHHLKLKTIHINSFGKLKNFHLPLSPGLNVIYGNNEAGKTTVMTFIKMMFYGTTARSSDIGKNARKKYAPWDGSPMSGYIEFEADGMDYRLEREFGNSNVSDTINLWNLTTGSAEPLSCKYDAGERFMGISASSFERSVFIGDISAVIHGNDRDDEITRKLMNYSSSADENISYETVRKRLQKAHEELRSKNKKNGEIDRLLTELSEKKELLSRAEEDEEQRKADEELHAAYCDILEKKTEHYRRLSDKIKEQRIIRELHSLEVQTRKNAVKSELENKISELTDRISTDTFTVTEAFLDECSDMLSRLTRMKEKYSERKNEFRELSNELSEMKLQETIESNDADIDLMSDEITEASGQLDILRADLSQTEAAKDEITDLIRETHIKEELWNERIAEAEPNYLVLIPGAVIIIVAVSLFIKNAWFLLSVIPVIPAVIFGTKLIELIARLRDRHAGIEHKAPDYEAAYRSYDEKMNEYVQQTDELNREIMLLTDKISGIQSRKNDTELSTTRLRMILEQKKSELEKLNDEINRSGSEISELNFHITEYFSEYRTVSGTSEIPELMDEALDTLAEIEKTKAVLESKLEEDIVSDTPEQINERSALLKEKLSMLTENSGLNLLSDIQTDAMEEELETLKNETASLKEQISDMRSRITSRYHDSLQPSQLINEINAIKKQTAGLAKYDQSLLTAMEVMEEAENEIRQTFAPELNSKTEKILSHLTGGKYSETIVSRDFDITSAENRNSSFREWQYLSTGTCEQAYFSLRLALADMMTGNKVPLFMDDVFAQYDEERTGKGFLFLNEYSRLNQVLFFTCHRYRIMSDQYTVFPENNE